MLQFILAVVLSQPAPAGLRVQDEGVTKGSSVSTINCTGAGVTCSVAGSRATVNVAGGGGSGLPADPAACPAGQYVTDQDIAGVLTCATPTGTYVLPDATNLVTGGLRLTGDLGGTAASPTVPGLASRSGTGACGASTWASTLNGAAAPTCTQPGFGNLAGSLNLATQVGTSRLPLANFTDNDVTASQCLLSGGAGGEPAWGACPGGGAPTGAQYWVGAADAELSAEKDLSGFTGLVLNTAGTPSSKGTNTCTNQFPRSDNASGTWTCASIASTDLPAASTALGAVKHAANCAAGNHVNGIGAGGELSCSADSGGGGAPTTAGYWTTVADAGLSAEVAMGALATGLVINTTTTGVPTIYAGATCTNQFPRSLSASGAATCASVVDADFSGSLGVTKGGAGVTSRAANDVVIGTGTNTTAAKTLPSCSNATTSKLLYDNATQTFSCGTDQTSGGGGGVGTLTRLTATWASSATANTLGIVGAGGVPMTSPSYAAGAPYSGRCAILMTRPSTANQPRYGIQSSGTVTTANIYAVIGLAGTLPARTEALQSTNTLATAGCAAGCTANVVTGGAARVFIDTIEIAGVMNATGTISLVMAPSAAAAHTAQIGSYCVWY